MSSSSSLRRAKERGGAGERMTALKPQKTTTENRPKDSLASCKKPTGKENPKSLSSAGTLSMCRNSKVPATARPGKEGESRVARLSTSLLPKGKTSNPSDISWLLLKLHSGSLSRCSGSDSAVKTLGKASTVAELDVLDVVKTTAKIFPVLEKCQSKTLYSCMPSKEPDEKPINRLVESENCKSSVLNSKGLDEKSFSHLMELENIENSGLDPNEMVLEDSKEKDLFNGIGEYLSRLDVLKSNSKGSAEKDVFSTESHQLDPKPLGKDRNSLSNCEIGANLSSGMQLSGAKAASGATTVNNYKDSLHAKKPLSNLGISGNMQVEDGEGENKVGQVVNRYPSKLHEKLAHLESKVKRIASDINRTKEMLDLNNPDASKLILSDIQDKISGVEKAMGHMENDGRGKLGPCEMVETDKLETKQTESNQDSKAGSSKNSMKILNHEELEARLFPHHKLLRDRVSLSNSAEKDLCLKSNALDTNGDSMQEEQSLSPIDENPIAMEFLASLGKNNPKINTGNRHDRLECTAIQEMDTDDTASKEIEEVSKKQLGGVYSEDVNLRADESFENIDGQESGSSSIIREEIEDSNVDQLREIGCKSSTGGWFVSEREHVLLVHDDSSCSFHDITNSEEKSEYKPPAGVSHSLWGDCWLVHAPGPDGCSGRYIVAASAGNALDSGFCSWDFYTKEICAFHVEGENTRAVLGPLSNSAVQRRNTLCTALAPGSQQWWYKPSGPLLVSTASHQKVVTIYDIRDGDQVMKWEVQWPVLSMDCSSPLQWRNSEKVVIAETEAITLWDVNSENPQSLLSVSSFGKKVSALHVNNTDAELGGGVRRRVTSPEAEGNDGVFCTQETINVLDFRVRSGIGLTMTKHGFPSHSISSYRDSIFLSSTDAKLSTKESSCSLVQQFSLRKAELISTYALPESNAHVYHSSITQVWGNSDVVMAVCGLGLFVFDTSKDVTLPVYVGHGRQVREVIGSDDLYRPSFDCLGSRVLLISRDRPALCKYLSS